MKTRFNMFFAMVASVTLVLGSTIGVAQGAMLDSATLLSLEQRAQSMHNIEQALSHDALARQMEAMGVDPAVVIERMAQLTDDELRVMESRLNDLPAGGDVLAVIGIVFVVLLILELVGVIDIFKRA
ncbi:MAG: PA2779 family protein [Gammaproteobacteria bacterium]|nr:PA2779 family protein [Gammaproteobacteria bacterium]